MYVFNSKTKAGRKYLEWIWPLRSCQDHHLQVAVWRKTIADEWCPESAQPFIFTSASIFASRRPTRVALWFVVGPQLLNWEPSSQLQDQHFKQLQSHCSSIVLTGKVKGQPCFCSCNRETQREKGYG